MNKFLQWLGIERNTVPEITAEFVVRHNESKLEIYNPKHLINIKTSVNVVGPRVSLPASFIPSTFVICVAKKTEGKEC